jgi:hypothetical protein
MADLTPSLRIGWNSQDITPTRPVELIGQYYQRISQGVRDPLAVTALAIEQPGEGPSGQVVMVSLDALYVRRDFQEEIRAGLRGRIPELEPRQVFLNATHIHSGAFWSAPFRWWSPAPQAVSPDEVRSLLRERTLLAIENAWTGRSPGGISDAQALAVTGFCRRTLHRQGGATMYGDPARDDFLGIEAGNDPVVRMLFTWDEHDALTGVVVNVACPAQVLESQYLVSADFFGELRRRLQAAYGPRVQLLAQVGPAGDQSPRNLPAQRGDEVNYWTEAGVVAIGQRLEQAVAEAYGPARRRIRRQPVVRHTVLDLELPVRRAGEPEYRLARDEVRRLSRAYRDVDSAAMALFARFLADVREGERSRPYGPFDNKELEFVRLENARAVLDRFESQDRVPVFPVELHAVRLGDCVVVSNPFELYLDYGQMIQARSPAARTFCVQLACDAGGYLPTERTLAAGGYGSLIINGRVGPDGGMALVEASIKAINKLWGG